MINNDLQAAVVYKTKDYSKFVLDNNYNREVDEKHVKKIVKSINTYGDQGAVFPIVVDNNFKVIDGQHRFTARKELGKVIYYIMDIELDSKVLGGINDAMKKWTKNDFVDVASDEEIVKVIEQIKAEINWGQLTNPVLISLLAINIKNVLSSDLKVKDRQLTNLNRKKDLFVYYMKDLLAKITNLDTFTSTRTSRVEVICKLALTLSKHGVSLNDIPTGTYEEIIAHLYSKGLIQ